MSPTKLSTIRKPNKVQSVSKDDLVTYLQSHTIFSDLAVKHIKILAQHAEEKAYVAGDLLFKQEDPAKSFYIIKEGAVAVEVPSVYGPPLEVQTLGKDDVLGWSWLIAPYKWTFEAKANSDSRVLIFDGSTLLKVCEKDTDFGYALMKRFAGLMSERLHAARLKMMETWAPAGWA